MYVYNMRKYKGTFLEYLVDNMDISKVGEYYFEFSKGGDFSDYILECENEEIVKKTTSR